MSTGDSEGDPPGVESSVDGDEEGVSVSFSIDVAELLGSDEDKDDD